MDCDQFDFCPTLSHKRIEQAKFIFGMHVIRRILTWTLYLLGASKPKICAALDYKPGTLRTLLYRVQNDGLGALEDRRLKGKSFQSTPTQAKVSLDEMDGEQRISLNGSQIKVASSNPLLYKSILLCLMNNKILSRQEVAGALQLSEDRVGRLAKKLDEEDVEGLIDQRHGQQQNYVLTPEVKGELIQQFVIDIVQDGKVSGDRLSKHIEERCEYKLSPRTILRYLSDMGLSNIKPTLLDYLKTSKKKAFDILSKEITKKRIQKEIGDQIQPRLLNRLNIMVLSQHNFGNTEIARFLGCHVETVNIWIKQFSLEGSIQHNNRCSRKSKFPEGTSQKVIGFFCQFTPLSGYVRWTLSTAFKHFQEHPEILGLDEGNTISRASIQRMLNAHALKPHRYKYFLQISDPDFFTKMEHIIGVYARVKENLFCFDECTGIQALEHKAPPIPVGSTRAEYREAEYIRHGSISVFSVLEVSSGEVFTEIIDDHTTATIIEVFKLHVASASTTDVLNYICDNYGSHSTMAMCETVASLSDVTLPEDLSTVEKRREWLGSTNKRIVLHFLPYHGSWLNLIENWFGIMTRNCLGSSVHSKEEKAQNILDFTETWNKEYAHPYAWTYTGENLRGKTVRKLTRWLHEETSIMTAQFLGKQLNLMTNLINEGWDKVSNSDWKYLASAFEEKQEYFNSIMENIDENTFKDIKAKTPESRAAKIALKIQDAKQKLIDGIGEFKSKIGAALAGVLNCGRQPEY